MKGVIWFLLLFTALGILNQLYIFKKHMQGSFSNNKQGIQSNLPSYRPMNQGTICAKVYPEGV